MNLNAVAEQPGPGKREFRTPYLLESEHVTIEGQAGVEIIGDAGNMVVIFILSLLTESTKSIHASAGTQLSSAPINMCIGEDVNNKFLGCTIHGGYIGKWAANV